MVKSKRKKIGLGLAGVAIAKRKKSKTLNVKSVSPFIAFRNKIIKLFEDAGLSPDAIKGLLVKYGLVTSAIPAQKVNYNEEFARLWEFTNEAFAELNRNDLAEKFRANVSVWDEKNHTADFVATLLKGAASGEARAGEFKRYEILLPLKSTMQEMLVSKGIAAPDDIADLTRLFYNTFVAVKNTEVPPLNFDEIPAENLYHIDESITGAVVTYLNDLANRKQSGEVLNKTQDKIATKVLQVKQRLATEAQKTVAQEVGQTVVQNYKGILIGVVALVVVLFFVFKR
jgi:hypothetical protein